ncbi:flavin-containing monooxygenase [Paeniglutamicibacter sp. ORCA_105]|uniref:flavin-containing monooxygenase n=1 Tax=Paeniglutamicibacter sp. ORCA_105 TaxID=3377336 RepID=UPI0038945788
MSLEREVDVVVVGAGFSGLYMLHKLRQQNLDVVVFERGDGVGGTWFWNRYPGARCDVESQDYSYSFSPELEQEWEWTERYPAQPEILNYLNHVADRFDLRRSIELETEVTKAAFDDGANQWLVTTDRGESIKAKYVVMATGCLSNGRVPDFDGMDTFGGEIYHTGSWPQEGVDFTGKRVGVIGTGSSGIQAIPEIAKQAEQLTVFQRTPGFSVPARNAPIDPEFLKEVKANYPQRREFARRSATGLPFNGGTETAMEATDEQRKATYESLWGEGGFRIGAAYADLIVNKDSNDTLAAFIHSKIDEAVDDPRTAEKLKPRDYPVSTKRICVDTDYYATYNRPNVSLVDVRQSPIVGFDERGLKTQDAEYEFDVVVFATGFDAMTGALLGPDITGANGLSLREHWHAGPRTYLGLSTVGFPNMFIVAGPGSPSVLTNMVSAIEQHVEWISDHLAHLEDRGLQRSEALSEAEDGWVAQVNGIAESTLFNTANSWYLGANVPGKPRIFMPYAGGFGAYRETCDAVAADGYRGFVLS